METEIHPHPKSKLVFQKISNTFGVLSLVFLGALGMLYVVRVKPEVLKIGSSGKSEEVLPEESTRLVAEIGKLMKLPEGEAPAIATVTDVDKVKDQSFFREAQNGDKVLIYSKVKKAILYRPSEKRIIEVGNVNLGSSGNSTPTTVTTTPTPPQTPEQ